MEEVIDKIQCDKPDLNGVNKEPVQSKKRISEFDLLKIISCIAVIMCHIFLCFRDSTELTASYIVGNIGNGLTMFAVPCFIMVSGGVLLDENKQCSLKDWYTKKLLKFIILLLTWCFLYTAVELVRNVVFNHEHDYLYYLEYFFTGPSYSWYIFLLCGLYILTPFLKAGICHKNDPRLARLFLLFSLIFVFLISIFKEIAFYIGPINFLITFFTKFKLSAFTYYLFYFVCGWYLYHVGISKKTTIAIFITGLVLMIGCVSYATFTFRDNTLYAYDGVANLFYSTGIFSMVTLFALKKITIKQSLVLSRISRITFGVFLVHDYFISVGLTVLVSYLSFDPIAAMFLTIPIAVILSFGTSFLISIIPGVKKLINC